MTAEVKIIPTIDSVADFKAGLSTWKPKTDEEAAKFLALRSIVGGKSGDAAKDAANARLERKCENCDVLEFDGFKLKKVMKGARIYNESKRVTKWEATIEELKEKLEIAKAELEAAKMAAGFHPDDEKNEKVFSHWLVQ